MRRARHTASYHEVRDIAIKSGFGRVDVPGDLSQYVRKRMSKDAFDELLITFDHALTVRAFRFTMRIVSVAS